MNYNFIAIGLLIISGGALLLSIRAFYQLYKMDLLGKNFWKESGVKNIFLYIIWISILINSIRLLLEKPNAANHLKLTLGIFWLAILISWLRHIVAGIKILFFNESNNFSDLLERAPFTKEVLEKTAASIEQLGGDDSTDQDLLTEMIEDSEDDFDQLFREETKKMIFGKTIGFLAVSGVLYWCVLFL